jgi:hypothetical protein
VGFGWIIADDKNCCRGEEHQVGQKPGPVKRPDLGGGFYCSVLFGPDESFYVRK